MQPQASMLVEDSKPLANLTQNNLIKDINKVGQNHKMDLASDTLWTHMGRTLISYMHIWLVEFEGGFA